MKKILIFVLCALTAFGTSFSAGCAKEEQAMLGGEPVSIADSEEYLVKDGASDYKIVISANASKTEKYAAEELRYFIEKSTAVKLPIDSDANVAHNNKGKYISVGQNELLAAEKDITTDYDELGQNGVTVNTKDNCVYISGATENGTLFAVYRFLHYQIGYEAYAYDCVEVNYYRTLKLKDFSYKYVPSLGLVTAEDAELSGEGKVKEAMRMYDYASKNGGYDLNGNLYNGLWCHTMPYIVTNTLDGGRVLDAENAEKVAKFEPYKANYERDKEGNYVPKSSFSEEESAYYANFLKGFDKAAQRLFSSTSSYADPLDDEVVNLYNYIYDLNNNVVPQFVRETTVNDEGKEIPVIKDGNYVYKTDEEGNPVLVTDENGDPVSDVAGYTAYENGWNACYDGGSYHVGSEWQKNVKKIRLWNNSQVCYSKKEAAELAAKTLIDKFVNTANGPYIMLGVTDGTGSCDCEDCRNGEALYGGPSGLQMRFMNDVANRVESYMKQNGIEKNIVLVAFAYYSYRRPPVVEKNGEYVPVDESVIPKGEGLVQVGVLYTPIEACFTHPITDDGTTCDNNARIAEEMKAWASITKNLMMYSYGTNFSAFKYHFNNWSHIGDSIRFYERCGLKYYFEQACTQNGVSPMSSMRAYVRAKLAWNSSYNTRDLINEFITHYYGEGSEGVRKYFEAVMENFERIYLLAGTEDQNIYYKKITSSDYWTRPLLKELESYLEAADYKISAGSSAEKDVYKERVFREYFLLKDNEYTKYSFYLNSEEYAALKELVMYGREKYNAYNSTEKTNNG